MRPDNYAACALDQCGHRSTKRLGGKGGKDNGGSDMDYMYLDGDGDADGDSTVEVEMAAAIDPFI